MTIKRFAQLNVELIKNLPPAMKAELIIFEDVIPDGIMNSLCVNDSFYNKERMDFLNNRPDLLEKMYYARGKRKSLAEHENLTNIETDEKVEFIKKYPQFKQLIEAIVYRDDNLNVVNVVPINQYLAEN